MSKRNESVSKSKVPPDKSMRNSTWQDPLFSTSHVSPLIALWDRVQKTQVDLGFPQELVAYYSSDQWMAASSVLDLGTGNGYYINKLASYFPDKTYRGVDSSEEFIEIAKSEKTVSNIEFGCLDVLDVQGQYDFVIMRLLLQHIQDVGKVLEHAAELTTSNGAALIIEPYFQAHLYRPAVPELKKFLAAYKAEQAAQGFDREIVSLLDDELDSNPLWRLSDRKVFIYPTTFPGGLELFQETIYLMLRIIKTSGSMQYDFDLVEKEWDWWCGLPDAYAQIGLAALHLDRVNP